VHRSVSRAHVTICSAHELDARAGGCITQTRSTGIRRAEASRPRDKQCFLSVKRTVFWLRPGVTGGRTGPNYDTCDPKDTLPVASVPCSVNDGDSFAPHELAAASIDYCHVPLSGAAPPRRAELMLDTLRE
jgi:hypothetical protein